MKIKVIDNFLELNDFINLKKIKLKKIANNEIKIYHNKINNKKIISNTCLSKKFLKKLHKNYHIKALNLLKELSPDKLDFYDYSEFDIIQTGKDYNFPIHDDTPDKLLSGVIYLKPKKNIGTIFYNDKKGNGKKEISWKQNRAVFFSRNERKSWHSFKSDGNSVRIALVYNLKTKKIRQVFSAENKNYFLGIFRYKLNPLLLKYFRFTI